MLTTPGRARAVAAVLTCAVAALAPAGAQDEAPSPEEAAHREATARARALVEEAFGRIEAYGRGAPLLEDGARARASAIERLLGPVAPRAPARRRPPLDPAEAHAELEQFRDLIRARLHALAPDRYPDPAGRDEGDGDDEAEHEDGGQPLPLRIFDVQDLVVAPEDHMAPTTGLGSSPEGRVLRYDDRSERTSGVGVDPNALEELIQRELTRLGHEEGTVDVRGGRLVTRLRPAAARAVTDFLALLRRGREGLVDLEVRVYEVTAEVYEALRGQVGELSDEAEARLRAGDGVTLLASHHVTAHDGQRVHVWRGRSRSYLADVEVNQTGIIPVLNPVVAVVNEGLVVEARPVVDRARGRAVVDVALTLSRVREPVEVKKVTDLEVELPQLQLARTAVTGVVRLGRGALMGGVLRTGAEPADALTCMVYVRPRLIAGGGDGR